jgi:hypothetical protein
VPHHPERLQFILSSRWSTEGAASISNPCPTGVTVAVRSSAIVTLVGVALAVLAFHGASVVGVVHGAAAGGAGPPLHGFTRHVGPPAPGPHPFALTLLVVGVFGVAGTAFFSMRRGWPGDGGRLGARMT